MFKPISKWVVKVEKSYIDLCFEFNTADGANDFYEVLRSAYAARDNDDRKVSVEIYAECEEEEEGEKE